MDEKLNRLYTSLSSKYNMPEFDAWKASLSDPEKLNKAYRYAKENFNNVGTIDEFKSDLFPSVKKKVSSKGSAFNWETGEIDLGKLSSSQPPVRTAAKKSDITESDDIQINWDTGEVKKSAFDNNKSIMDSLRQTMSDFQEYQSQPEPISGDALDGVTKYTSKQYAMLPIEATNRGVYEQALGGGLKGLGEMTLKAVKMIDPTATEKDMWLWQMGDAIQGLFREGGVAEYTTPPELMESDAGQVFSGLGQGVAMILTGGGSAGATAMSSVPKSVPLLTQLSKGLFGRSAMVGTMQIVGDGAEKLREEKSIADQMDRDGYVRLNIQQGLDEKAAGEKYDKLKSADVDDLISEMLPTWFMEGSTEGLMVGEWFKRFNKATNGSFGKVFMEKAKDVTIGTFEGAAQEALQTWMENATAKEVYDYTLETTEGMAQSAKVGGAVQFILETMSAALGAKNRSTSGGDKAFIEKAQEEIKNRKELLAKNLDNALVETVKMEDVRAELNKKVEAGDITQEEAIAQAREIETKKAAIEKIPEDQKTNPDVVEAVVEKAKVDEEIAAKKEEMKSVDPAFQQDAKNEIAALEVKSAELSLRVAEKAGVTPDEKAVKLLEPKEGEAKPVAKEPEAPKMEPVTASDLEVGRTYYNEDTDRNYVFVGVDGNGMMLFDKVAKKGEVLMTTRVDSFPESNFMKKLFGARSEQAASQEPKAEQAQETISPTEPIASQMAQEAVAETESLAMGVPPPVEPIGPPIPGPTGDTVEKTVIKKRAYDGTIREGVRAYLEEKGLTRERVSQSVRSQQAEQMIADLGEDAAVEAVRMGEVRGALASATLFNVVKRIDERMSATEDAAEMDYLAKKQADLIGTLNDMAFEGGEFNSQFAREYIESDIGYNLAVKKHDYIKQFGSISPEVEAKFEELDAQMKELKAKLADAERRAADAADAATIEAIKAEADRKKPAKASISQAGKEMAKKIRKGKLSRPGTFSAASPASIVWDTAIEIAATAVEAGTALAEAIQMGLAHIRQSGWYKGLSSDKRDAAEQEYVDFLTEQEDTVGVLKVPKSLIRDLVAGGIDNVPNLVDAVRLELGLAEESDREIRDAITDYGKTINMTKDEISTEVRRLRRVGRLISALEDVAERKRPLRSGLQRDKLTAEERTLQKQLREEMKGLPMDEETLASELKTTLDAKKSRLRNRIEDLNNAIESNQKIVKPSKTIEADAEANDLIAERDRLQKIYEDVFSEKPTPLTDGEKKIASLEGQLEKLLAGNLPDAKDAPQYTPEETERIKRLRDELFEAKAKAGLIPSKELPKDPAEVEIQRKIKAKEKAIISLTEKLAKDDLSTNVKKQGTTSPELQALESEYDALRDELKKRRDALKTVLTPEQKSIKRLQEELDDLIAGNVKNKQKAVRQRSQEEKDLMDEIARQKELMGLVPPKRTQEQIKLDRLDAAIAETERLIAENELEFKKKKEPLLTPAIEAKAELLKASQKELQSLREQAGILEARRLAGAKKATRRSIEELERRLRERDFAKKERKPLLEDSELTNLRAEKLRIREEYDKEFYKEELNSRSKWQKAKDALWDAWGVTRVLSASLDASFMFVQGGMLTISNPSFAVKATKAALGIMSSESRADEFIRKIKSQDWYPIAKQSGMKLTEAHASAKASEELFFSQWSDFIWDELLGIPARLAGKSIHEKWRKVNPFKATERAAVGYLDTLRILKFQEMMAGPLAGKNFSDNKQEFKDAADAINTLTGRASLGAAETLAPILTKAIFSPRNWASQVKMFSPYALIYFSRLSPSARKMALVSMAKFVGFNAAMMMLVAQYLNNDDDDETSVEYDPRSSDFMKAKVGDTRIDPWGGKIQQVTFAVRMFMDAMFDISPSISAGGFKKGSGEVLPLGMKNKTSDKKDLALQQVFNKLSPSARLVYNYLNAQRTKNGMQDDFGNKYSFSEDLRKSMYPMFFQTVVELKQDGVDVTDGVFTFLALMGYGVNVYDNKKKKKEEKK